MSNQLHLTTLCQSWIYVFNTINMPQRTSKISLVQMNTHKNAVLFQIRVTYFARYTVLFDVTRSDQNTLNEYITQSHKMITMRNFLLHCALYD